MLVMNIIDFEGDYILIDKDKIVLNKKAILIGIFLVILLTGIFIQYAGNLSGYLEYLIAAIIVGYIVGESIINGMFNGIMASLIGGITALFINFALLQGNYDIIELLFILVISIFIMIIMGLIGGLVGSFVKINVPTNFQGKIKGFIQSLINSPNKKDRVLKCTSCGGEYLLQPDELPGDFESCSCGGELEFYDIQGRKRPYTTNYPKERKEMPLGTKILILVVVLIFALYYLLPYLVILSADHVDPSAGVYLFPVFFIISIAVILILVWYAFIRK